MKIPKYPNTQIPKTTRFAAWVLGCLGIWVFASAAFATTTVKFDLVNFTTSSVTNRKVVINPLTAPANQGGQVMIGDTALYTATNGIFYVSNMIARQYKVELQAPPRTTIIYIEVTNSASVLDAGTLLIANPGDVPSYYTKEQQDALAASLTNLTSQTEWPASAITNAPWIGSAGVAYTVADGWSILGASNVAIQTQIGQLILKAGELQFWETNRIKGGIKGGILSIDGSGITNLPATLYTNGAADLLPGQIVLATIGTNTLSITNRYGGNSFGLTNLNGLPYRYISMTNGQSVYPVFYGFAGGTPGIDGLATNWPGVVFLDTNGTQAGQIFYIGDHAIDGYGTYAAHGEMQMMALGDIAIRPGTGGNLNDSWIQLGNSSTLGDTHIAPAYIPARGSNGLALGTFVSGIYTNIGTTNMPASGTLSFTSGGSPSARPAIQGINVSGLQGQSPWTGNPDRGYGGLLFWASPPVPGQSQGGTPYYYDAAPGVLAGAMDGTNGWWFGGTITGDGSGLTNLYNATLPLTGPTRFVYDGDSLTANANSYDVWMSNCITSPLVVGYINTAAGGLTTTNLGTRFMTNVAPYKPAGGTNAFYFAWVGINDVSYAATAPNIITGLTNLWNTAKTNGFKVVAFTLTDRNDWVPRSSRELVRLDVNSFILSSEIPDFIVDTSAMFKTVNTNFQPDGVHFSTNACRLIAQNVIAALHQSEKVVPVHGLMSTNLEVFGPVYSSGAADVSSLAVVNTGTFASAAYGISPSGFWGASAGYGSIAADLMTSSPRHGSRWTYSAGTATFTNGAHVFNVDGTLLLAMTNGINGGVVGIGITNPLAKLDVGGSIIARDGITNLSSEPISSAGGILYSQTNLYDDLIWYPSDINPPGGLTGPTIVATSGRDGESLAAVFNADDASVFIAKMPHVWVPGSTLWSHFHVEPQTTAGVTNVWRIKHSIADIDGTFPAWTITTNTTTIAPNRQWNHVLVAVPTNGIPMTGFAGPSTIAKYRIECISGNVDTHVVAADLHYRVRGSPVPFNAP